MKALIYDLDGTLLDTLEDIAIACNDTLQNASFGTHPVAAYRKMVGNGFETLLKRAIGREIPNEELKQLVEKARKFYAAKMLVHTRPYPGISESLEALQKKGIWQAIFSNKPDLLSGQLARHYFPGISFGEIIGAREGRPLKPNPEVLLEMLDKASVSPQDAIYVGDSDVDVLTAKNAGVKCAGVAWGFRGARELKEAGAEYIIHSPEELEDVIRA